MSLVISYLDDYPECLPQLAVWAFEAWGRYNPSSSVERAQDKLKTHLNKIRLPLTYKIDDTFYDEHLMVLDLTE